MKRREKTELEIAKEHYNEWLEAELELTTSQSYAIGSQTLTRADLGKIAERIDYWRGRIAQLENIQKHKGRNRVIRVVPRDL